MSSGFLYRKQCGQISYTMLNNDLVIKDAISSIRLLLLETNLHNTPYVCCVAPL